MALLNKIGKPSLADEKNCIGCLACVASCHIGALSSYVGDDGHNYVRLEVDKCIGCLRCQEVCNHARNNFGVNDISKSSIFAAWTKNESDRANSTSGGVFAALSRTVISNGGAVSGANLNGFDCRHIIITDGKDISKLQGSKYMTSSMEHIYGEIEKNLKERDVLFSGLGCQCAGVLAYFEGKTLNHQLYTVDIVCGGAPSSILIEKYKKIHPETKGLLSFRSKDKYILKVFTNEGEKEIPEKNLILHGFNCGMTNRYSCYECPFAKAHRKTNITIGDLWDYSKFFEEHAKGISMVLIHDEIGMKLLEKSDLFFEEIDWKSTLLKNKRIVCGHQNIYGPRTNLIQNAKKMNDTRFEKLYCVTMKPMDVDLFIFRVYRYLREKSLAKKNEKFIQGL